MSIELYCNELYCKISQICKKCHQPWWNFKLKMLRKKYRKHLNSAKTIKVLIFPKENAEGRSGNIRDCKD